ncbi:hypothetical protein AVEN_140630-1 [Araneus ventricosus]|uniref:Uncharacterized protein n=1 Tax=Araneus ventricosus TaxID=182803 RepID=A0A4Y2U8Z6_ARAVE|nr:hypothetical protein AVEN_140630-1 [Araneus ventricosus]
MGHRTEQVPQREVLIKTPPKGAGFQLAPAVCSLVDMMKRVNYLEPEKPLVTKGQAQKSESTVIGNRRKWWPATERTNPSATTRRSEHHTEMSWITVNILKKIKESPDYDADFALDTIKCIREEKEIEEKRLERQEATRLAEAAQIREYELEKLRLTQSNDTASVRSNASNGSQNYRIPSIKSVLSPFDPEKSDVSLFLTVFKRQAEKFGIPDEELVTQLISVLPANMTELIIRDTGDDTDDFEVVKKILLERFRLSTDAYRVKYMTHQKGVNSLWKDLVFELNSYFNGWLEGAK